EYGGSDGSPAGASASTSACTSARSAPLAIRRCSSSERAYSRRARRPTALFRSETPARPGVEALLFRRGCTARRTRSRDADRRADLALDLGGQPRLPLGGLA